MSPRLVTLTLSPSVDLSTSTPLVRPEHKLRCTAGQLDPGGGGLNVSRVVHELGGTTLAVFASGGVTGKLLEQRLEARSIPILGIPCEAATRICFNAGESDTGHEYRFVLPGAPLTTAELRGCIQAVENTLSAGDVLVISGSLPPGLDPGTYAQIARSASARGAKVVLDTSGAPLKAGLDEALLLAKPSRRELREMLGQPLETVEALAAACRELHAARRVEVLVVSMGAGGALLTCAEGQWFAPPPEVEARSAVGAGDSFVAAMALSLSRGESVETALAWGTAAGASALLTSGTQLCLRHDVERLFPLVRPERLALVA